MEIRVLVVVGGRLVGVVVGGRLVGGVVGGRLVGVVVGGRLVGVLVVVGRAVHVQAPWEYHDWELAPHCGVDCAGGGGGG